MAGILRLILVFIATCQVLQGQDLSDNYSTESDTLSYISMEADSASHITAPNHEIDTLVGNVLLIQDSLLMYCDWAVVVDQLNARAYDNVVIIHHDTIQIFADSMLYNGEKKISELFGEVILQDGERRLYTTELEYDVENKIAEYLHGGTLVDGVDTIISREGYYLKNDKTVKLKGNVSFKDSIRLLLTDSIDYLYDIDQLNIIAPTRISQDSIDIYCESGLYRLESDRGILSNNVQVHFEDQLITSEVLDINGEENKYTFLINPKIIDQDGVAKGDTIVYYDELGQLEIIGDASYITPEDAIFAPVIIYDRNTEKYSTKGRAQIRSGNSIVRADDIKGIEDDGTLLSGSVSIIDNENKIKIESDIAIKRKWKTIMYSNYGQPLLSYGMEEDSLLILADTLINNEITADSDSAFQILNAINNVRLQSGATFGVSERFQFNQSDSIIVMWGSPVLWSDSIQMSGDTIELIIIKNKLTEIKLIGNAFIIAPDNNGMLNHMKGLAIDNFVENKSIKRSVIMGNAELFYLIEKDGNYEGINITKGNKMKFIFDQNEIQTIRMEGVPESNMFEYNVGMNLDVHYLDGFNWRISEKPEPELFLFQSKY